MQLSRQETIALIREQVRATVDPMLLRLRQELYGSAFANHLRGDVIPPDVIVDAVNRGVQDAVEGQAVLSPYQIYKAGPAGVQTGKVVYFDGSVVQHASANTLAHAGKVVGIAAEPGGPGSDVRIQTYSTLELGEGFTYGVTGGILFLGNSGSVVASPPNDSKFVQAVAIALSANKVFVTLSPEIYGV